MKETIILITLLAFTGCAKPQEKPTEYICSSDGVWLQGETMKPLKDKDGNPLSCLDGKILQWRF